MPSGVGCWDYHHFSVTDAFYDLGGDSLKAVTMMALVDGEFGVTLPPELNCCATLPTISEARGIRHAKGQGDDAKRTSALRPVARLRVGQDRPRLFSLSWRGWRRHVAFSSLSERLPVGQAVDGVLYPELENAVVPASMKDLAASCLRGIKSVQPEGPII